MQGIAEKCVCYFAFEALPTQYYSEAFLTYPPLTSRYHVAHTAVPRVTTAAVGHGKDGSGFTRQLEPAEVPQATYRRKLQGFPTEVVSCATLRSTGEASANVVKYFLSNKSSRDSVVPTAPAPSINTTNGQIAISQYFYKSNSEIQSKWVQGTPSVFPMELAGRSLS